MAILLGFGFRIYDLDADSLWNDEAGQALAALQPTLADTLVHVQMHAAAMPLDYLVTRLFIHLSTGEFVLRFPSVFWSTASIAMLFAVARHVVGREVAHIAVWLMAFAPQLVYYAQEARPYAALLFFSLLTTYLLLLSLSKDDAISWGLWGIATVIGAYFHLYVLLNVVFGGTFLLFARFSGNCAYRNRVLRLSLRLIVGISIVAVLVMPGYLVFASKDSFRYEMFQYGGSIWTVTATGLGWPIHRYFLQSALLMFFTGGGVAIAFARQRNNLGLMALLVGVPCIVVAVLLMNLVRGYWYLPRQLLHLQPLVLIFAAFGCCVVSVFVGRLIRHQLGQAERTVSIVAAFLILIIVATGATRLHDNYAYPKGNARELTQVLLAQYSKPAMVYVEPAYEMKVYAFYAAIIQADSSEALSAALRAVNLEEMTGKPDTQYLLASPAFISENMKQLVAAGYRPLVETPTGDGYLRSLWYRP